MSSTDKGALNHGEGSTEFGGTHAPPSEIHWGRDSRPLVVQRTFVGSSTSASTSIVAHDRHSRCPLRTRCVEIIGAANYCDFGEKAMAGKGEGNRIRRVRHRAAVAMARSSRIEDEVARRGIKQICPRCCGFFSIDVDEQVWRCDGCHPRPGDVIELVKHLDRIDFREAARRLAGRNDPDERSWHPYAMQTMWSPLRDGDRREWRPLRKRGGGDVP